MRVYLFGSATVDTYHDIQTTKLFHCSINDSFDLCLLADVTFDGESGAVGEPLSDQGSHRLDSSKVNISENNLCTFLCKQKRCFESDSTDRARIRM